MLNSYSKTKSELNDIITDFGNTAVSKHSKETAQLIGNKLEANIFSLVVVGQFKRGKTTLINALLGQNILPMGIIPLTSAITILNYGEELKINVFFENGVQKEITLDDLPQYVTEKYNPENKKMVNRVEVAYQSQYLKNGVQIIDTPGVASVHEHNTRTTYQYLSKADAAIFLISIDPPLTQAELIFLRDLKNKVSKIFFIQNKKETVSDSDRQESLDFTKKVIEERAGFKDPVIYLLSAKDALEGKMDNNLEKVAKSGLLDFEQSLEQFLLNEKGNILLSSSAEKIGSAINEELLLAELEEKSLRIPLRELENKLKDFKGFLSEINQECIDSGRLLTAEVQAFWKDVFEENLEKLKEEKTEWFNLKIKELSVVHKRESNKRLIELFNEFIAVQIREIFGAWREEEEKVLKSQFKKILSRFTNRMNDTFKKIFSSSSEIFGITQREIKIQETLPPEIEFRFQTESEEDALSMTIDTIKKIMPKTFAHRLIIQEAKDRADMLVDRHCGKLRYDFSQRMEKLVEDYKKIFSDAVESMEDDVLRALEIGLTRKQKTETEVTKQETDLRNRIAKLTDLQKSVQNLL